MWKNKNSQRKIGAAEGQNFSLWSDFDRRAFIFNVVTACCLLQVPDLQNAWQVWKTSCLYSLTHIKYDKKKNVRHAAVFSIIEVSVCCCFSGGVQQILQPVWH